MYSFSATLAGLCREGESFVVAPGAEWLQGRTIYGGLSAALAIEAAQRMFPDLPPLRGAQIAYVGPSSGSLSIRPQILRAGRSASFVSVSVSSDGAAALQATLCFAAHRPSALSYQELARPSAPAPQSCEPFFNAVFAPRSSRQFDGRIAGGGRAVSAAATPSLLLWLRHRDETAPDTVSSIVALADAPPPGAFTMFKTPAPISTMTWSFELLADAFKSTAWHLARSFGDVVEGGYSSQSTCLWDTDGRPVIVGRQLVALYQ